VIEAGGHRTKFVATVCLRCSALMAIRRLRADRRASAAMVASNVEYMNHEFASELQTPIQFGIGIHGGETSLATSAFRAHIRVHRAGGPPGRGQCRGPPARHEPRRWTAPWLSSEEVCQERRYFAGAADRGRDFDPRPRSAMRVCTQGSDLLASLLDEQAGPARAEQISARTMV